MDFARKAILLLSQDPGGFYDRHYGHPSRKRSYSMGQALPEVPPLAELATASDVAPPNLGLFPQPLPGGYMLLKVFSFDDLRSTTNDHKKIELLQRQYWYRIHDTKAYWMEIKFFMKRSPDKLQDERKFKDRVLQHL
ncbi:hypothetical protein B296_00041314 [Ensete ventricosum]|uniref:Uncharacterized protein n=1 Tax=Ensete ventricosum TaxID=4639 RepID=A0A426Y4U3_ENSVE|nr:hypothetical protein B296_00041314 [Ensete ventricosum]